jgi:hypothetical protein
MYAKESKSQVMSRWPGPGLIVKQEVATPDFGVDIVFWTLEGSKK